MLELQQVHIHYGQSHVIRGVSLSLAAGEAVCLLGRNGAGKTTIIRGIMGLTPPTSGNIRFMSEEIVGKPPYQICRKGVGYVPQGRRIFPDLTVDENLEVTDGSRQIGGWTPSKIFQLLPELATMRQRKAGTLSGGEQQMLAIARALMTKPKVLLMDEPSAGLAPMIRMRLERLLREMLGEGVGVLLAEQNIRFALNVCSRGYVIDRGLVRFQGQADSLLREAEIVQKYLAV